MIRKLIISAVVLTALIAGKEAHAAGPAGFARALAESAPAAEIAGLASPARQPSGFTAAKRSDVIRISAAVEETINAVDTYLDTFSDEGATAASPAGCFDCADVKRALLEANGWNAGDMRIAYAISDSGRIERVLIVETALGDLVIGSGRPVFAAEARQAKTVIPAGPASHYDI